MGEFFQTAFRLVKGIFPLHTHDPKEAARWQWSISMVVFGLLVAFLLNVAVAYGLMPPIWYAPETQFKKLDFQTDALTTQVSVIARDVDMTLKLDLGKEMRDNQLNRCTSQSSQERQNLSNILDTEEQYYFNRFGVYYQLPQCDQL